MKTLSGDVGSLTIIGAVSPPAGDFSEPVTSHTKRYVRSLLGARSRTRAGPLLSGRPSAAVLFGRRLALRGMVDRARQSRLALRSASGCCRCLEAPSRSRTHGTHRRQGRPAAGAAADAALRGPGQRGLPAPVRLLAGRPLLLAGAADCDAQAHSALHRARRGCARSRRRAAGDRRARRPAQAAAHGRGDRRGSSSSRFPRCAQSWKPRWPASRKAAPHAA